MWGDRIRGRYIDPPWGTEMKKSAYAVVTVTVFLVVASVAPAAAATLGVATSPASAISNTAATLQGQVSPDGAATTYYFEYGTTTAYGKQTAETYVQVPPKSQTVSATIAGLTPGTLYHFRAAAAQGAVVYGTDRTFATTGAPAVTPPSGQPAGVEQPSPAAPATTPTGVLASLGDNPFGALSGPGSPSTPPATGAGSAVLGSSVGVAPAGGSISVRVPGTSVFVPLTSGSPVPVGTTVDASRGVVSLVTAVDSHGHTQAARFTGGLFLVSQSTSGQGVTEIALRGGDFSVCRKPATRAFRLDPRTAAAPRPVRGLWGSDSHGRFRTRGSHAIATVRGTVWMVADRCDGTLTKVAKGAVSVQDLTTHRTVLVRAGKSYLARTRRR